MSDDLISLPNQASLRREFAYVVGLLADQSQNDPAKRVWYRYGGCDDPATGLDCSGLVIWSLRRLSTPIAIGRPTADWFWHHLAEVAEGDVLPGDLAFYGQKNQPVTAAHHVVVVLNGGGVATMSGGGPACQTVAYAKVHSAYLRVKDSPRYRDDLLGFRRVDFSRASGVVA